MGGGVEQTPNKSQHTKLNLEKKILLPSLQGFTLATFQSRVRQFYQQALLTHNHQQPIQRWQFLAKAAAQAL